MKTLKKHALILASLLFINTATLSGTNSFFTDTLLEKFNLVNIRTLDSTIFVDLRYATADNFAGQNMYGTLTACYLRKEAAEKLVNAQHYLSEIHPGYHLLVYDGLRPRSVQRIMWNIVKGTPQQSYVANPETGSIHNYGAAVDLTIADAHGLPIDMGTPFDYFGVKAQPRYEKAFNDSSTIDKTAFTPAVKKAIREDLIKTGVLSESNLQNRLLLRNVMEKAGFLTIPNEWWHFNAFDKGEIKQRFTIIE